MTIIMKEINLDHPYLHNKEDRGGGTHTKINAHSIYIVSDDINIVGDIPYKFGAIWL